MLGKLSNSIPSSPERKGLVILPWIPKKYPKPTCRGPVFYRAVCASFTPPASSSPNFSEWLEGMETEILSIFPPGPLRICIDDWLPLGLISTNGWCFAELDELESPGQAIGPGFIANDELLFLEPRPIEVSVESQRRDRESLADSGRWRSRKAGKNIKQEQMMPRFTSRVLVFAFYVSLTLAFNGDGCAGGDEITYAQTAMVERFLVRSGLEYRTWVMAILIMLAMHTLAHSLEQGYLWTVSDQAATHKAPSPNTAMALTFLLKAICIPQRMGMGMMRTMMSVKELDAPENQGRMEGGKHFPLTVGSQLRSLGLQLNRVAKKSPTFKATTKAMTPWRMYLYLVDGREKRR